MLDLVSWEESFRKKIAQVATASDPAHDQLHFERVVAMAKQLATQEGGSLEVVVPAAWLHDFVIVPKDDPRRSLASRLSAEAAIEYLHTVAYPPQFYEAIAHAIEGHSFSAKIEVQTLEAKIVQDADRLDGLGAIGIARCFATAALLKRPFYAVEDPFCEQRAPDDALFTVDHFFKKLFQTAQTLQTAAGRAEGQRRVMVMQNYLSALRSEIVSSRP